MSSKKRTFIANQNGDWWEYTPGEKLAVFVVDSEETHFQVMGTMFESITDAIDSDIIWNFGSQVSTPIKEK